MFKYHYIRKIISAPYFLDFGLVESYIMTYHIENADGTLNYESWKIFTDSVVEKYDEKYNARR